MSSTTVTTATSNRAHPSCPAWCNDHGQGAGLWAHALVVGDGKDVTFDARVEPDGSLNTAVLLPGDADEQDWTPQGLREAGLTLIEAAVRLEQVQS